MKDKVIEVQKEQPETRAETFSMVVNSYNPGSGEAGRGGTLSSRPAWATH